jgi:hypothetical protein
MKNSNSVKSVSVESHSKSIESNSAITALKASYNGLLEIWAHEDQHRNGQKFVAWLFQIFQAVALPLIMVTLSGIAASYRFAASPKTHAAVKARYQSVKAFLKSSAPTELPEAAK